MANRIPTATDQTNCEHDVREVWGVNRCVTCHRMFEEVDGVMVVEPVRLPSGLDSGAALRERRVASGRAAAFTRAGVTTMAVEVERMEESRKYSRIEMYEATALCYPSNEAEELSEMVDQLLDGDDMLERVRQMIPALEENASTKGIARKLRAILGVE